MSTPNRMAGEFLNWLRAEPRPASEVMARRDSVIARIDAFGAARCNVMSDVEIGKLLDCSRDAVRGARRRNGLKQRAMAQFAADQLRDGDSR